MDWDKGGTWGGFGPSGCLTIWDTLSLLEGFFNRYGGSSKIVNC